MDYLSEIENIIGSDGIDQIIGDDNNNYLDGGHSADVLKGMAGSDTLAGGTGDDDLDGGIGDDTLLGELGNDLLRGNEGNDTLNGGDGYDEIEGGAGEDVLLGGLGEDVLNGNDGNDVVNGGDGKDELNGGSGDDRLAGGLGDDLYRVDSSNDTIEELSGGGIDNVIAQVYYYQLADHVENIRNEYLFGATLLGNDISNKIEGNNLGDRLFGKGGNDLLIGGDGNDFIEGGAGDDDIQGGEGIDTASFFDSLHGVTIAIDGISGKMIASSIDGSDTLEEIETIVASQFDDMLSGDTYSNTIYGEDGNDSIDGAELNDDLYGGSGNDTFFDWQGHNTIEGDSGSNTFSYQQFQSSGLFSPTVTIDLGEKKSYVEADLFAYDSLGLPSPRIISSSNQFSNIQNAIGSIIADRIIGDAGANYLNGLDGHDSLTGMGGDDRIDGGNGNDTVSYDYLTTNEWVIASLITGARVFDTENQQVELDELVNIENLVGSQSNDRLTGNDEANTLSGGNGTDYLYGLGGNDTLIGGAGEDHIDGGDDIDTIDLRSAASFIYANLTEGQTFSDGFTDYLQNIENIFASRFDDQIIGDAMDNFFDGGDGNDTISGGSGNDVLVDLGGTNSLDGEDGIDTVSFASAGARVNASLFHQTASYLSSAIQHTSFLSQLLSIENIIGSAFDDEFEGNEFDNSIDGGSGNDMVSYNYLSAGMGVEVFLGNGIAQVFYESEKNTGIYQYQEFDILASMESVTGSSGADLLIGSNLDNVLIGGSGADSLIGGGGNDKIYAKLGEDAIIDGGEGSDTLYLTNTMVTATRQLLPDLSSSAYFSGIENISTGYLNDKIFGSSADNWIDGGSGNDIISGYDGNDVLLGGDGFNFIEGGLGHNLIDGSGASTPDGRTIATYSVSASLSIDLSKASNNATLLNPADSNFILIDDYIDVAGVRSGSGNDIIAGNGGNNALLGQGGNDTIFGRDGNDILDGGVGSDTLSGGFGVDLFVFQRQSSEPNFIRETDFINDFGLGGSEKIDITDFDQLNSNQLTITNFDNHSVIRISDTNYEHLIYVEGPAARTLSENDLLFIGGSSPQFTSFLQGLYSI